VREDEVRRVPKLVELAVVGELLERRLRELNDHVHRRLEEVELIRAQPPAEPALATACRATGRIGVGVLVLVVRRLLLALVAQLLFVAV
jgi:hypothetical protein